MNAIIEGDIQICISVPLNYTKNNGTYEFLESIFSNNFTPQINLPAKRNFSDNLKNPNAESLFMTQTTPEEIPELIQTLSSNKSTGPNSILTSVLKKIKND